ncbi:MAG: glycoside hydrolase family 9 protein [Actinomycetota bacterium]
MRVERIRLVIVAIGLVTVLAAAACGAPVEAAGGSGTGFVRVNQVGYPGDGPKRAYLLSPADATGATFEVRADGGAVVASGSIGERLGRWSKGFTDVYAIDFDAVTTPGTYTIAVEGPVAAASPAFEIGDPRDLFGPLLANALEFYRAQRDGPDVIPGALGREPSHLHDRRARVFRELRFTPDLVPIGPVPVPGAARIDVSGGWFDAGDYIKGVQTESYTAALLLMARRDHPGLLGPGSAADFTDELRFELDWLLKMWDDQSQTLYYQVGFGDGNARYEGDHGVWRLPEEDDRYGAGDPAYRFIRHRPVFRAGPAGSPVSPNLAGRLAAAFGLCAQVFRPTDPVFAGRCLLAGQHVFDLADTDPGRLVTFSPFDYYPETEWHSDLELGAIELMLATAAAGPNPGLPHADAAYYLEQAAHWAGEYVDGDELGDTLNLYDVSALAHAELAAAIADAGNPSGLEVDRQTLIADVARQLDGAVDQSGEDPFGFGFPYAAYDGTSHGQGLAITALLYEGLTGDDAYAVFGRHQLDVVLGANAWGTSFIVGAGSTFPRCLHHQVANLSGGLDGTPPLLVGAAVNGTNSTDQFAYLGVFDETRPCPPGGGDAFGAFDGKGARYWDNVRSWPTVEPAIDFAATTPLAFALLIASA